MAAIMETSVGDRRSGDTVETIGLSPHTVSVSQDVPRSPLLSLLSSGLENDAHKRDITETD